MSEQNIPLPKPRAVQNSTKYAHIEGKAFVLAFIKLFWESFSKPLNKMLSSNPQLWWVWARHGVMCSYVRISEILIDLLESRRGVWSLVSLSGQIKGGSDSCMYGKMWLVCGVSRCVPVRVSPPAAAACAFCSGPRLHGAETGAAAGWTLQHRAAH